MHWILGTLTAFSGVAFVRLLTPTLSGGLQTAVALIGYALAFFGIFILAKAIGKKPLKMQRR